MNISTSVAAENFHGLMGMLVRTDEEILRERGLVERLLALSNAALEGLLVDDMSLHRQLVEELEGALQPTADCAYNEFTAMLGAALHRHTALIGEVRARMCESQSAARDDRYAYDSRDEPSQTPAYSCDSEPPSKLGEPNALCDFGERDSPAKGARRHDANRRMKDRLFSRDSFPRPNGDFEAIESSAALWTRVADTVRGDIDKVTEESAELRASRECRELFTRMSEHFASLKSAADRQLLEDVATKLIEQIAARDDERGDESLASLFRKVLSAVRGDAPAFGARLFFSAAIAFEELANSLFSALFELLTVLSLFHRSIEPSDARLKAKNEIRAFIDEQKANYERIAEQFKAMRFSGNSRFVDFDLQETRFESIARTAKRCAEKATDLTQNSVKIMNFRFST